jgi:hypothetical protein
MSRKPLSHLRTSLELAAFVAVIALGVALYCHFHHRPESDTLNVPLGVEQAAIVTYSGPEVTVAPYKWGVAVNVRIAQVVEHDGARVYDVRYLVNRAGTFDLKDYLVGANGSPLAGLPSFKFVGDARLSKNLDQRIQETEENRVEVGGYYYEKLAVLGVLWIVWLLLLIFYKRSRPAEHIDAAPAAPTLAERMRTFLAQLESGSLDAEAKARLEMAMLQCWREQLALGDATMISALDQIARHDSTGEPLRKLQHWLYHPASPVQASEIAAIMAAYTREPKSAEPAEPVGAS